MLCNILYKVYSVRYNFKHGRFIKKIELPVQSFSILTSSDHEKKPEFFLTCVDEDADFEIIDKSDCVSNDGTLPNNI